MEKACEAKREASEILLTAEHLSASRLQGAQWKGRIQRKTGIVDATELHCQTLLMGWTWLCQCR